ncbi:hypothetical protein PR202_gb01790 [Eleusine coracana subsp. coracana]|uniref:Uncharacterized protein n=1 Tax=Eleusine coracana subsp. coracana TaxID=191504 RepID=A0AAV5DWJ0_ELECO|nr:hypothetical protein PR202_gb01790 [Eleusine coracana subsp. coracana]
MSPAIYLQSLLFRFLVVFLLECSELIIVFLTKQWMPELRRFAPNVPVVLVGTKLDLRDHRAYLADHPGVSTISTAEGEELRKQIGAAAYIECSSKTQQEPDVWQHVCCLGV